MKSTDEEPEVEIEDDASAGGSAEDQCVQCIIKNLECVLVPDDLTKK